MKKQRAIAGSRSCCEIIDQRREPITLDEFQKLMSWTYSEKGTALAKAWHWMNEGFFHGILKPCPILLPSSPPYGHWIGLCTGNPEGDTLHIQVKRDLELKQQFNVLLHECLHAYLRELKESTDHNARPWCREIVRLTGEIWNVEIHAAPDSPRKVNGRSVRIQKPSSTGMPSITRCQIAGWPYSIGLVVPYEQFCPNYSQLQEAN
jgi:hypothetical protein